MIADRYFVLDLIIIVKLSFDVILGMDWLSTYRAYVNCFKRKVTFVYHPEILVVLWVIG